MKLSACTQRALITGTLLDTLSAFAANWQSFKSFTYDADSIRREGPLVYVWAKEAFGGRMPVYNNGVLVRYDEVPNGAAHTLFRFDCNQRTRQQIEINLFDSRGVLQASHKEVYPADNVAPTDDVMELLPKLCKKAWEFWK